MARPEISNAEWQVMNIVWENQPTTASEIIKQLAKTSEWTSATIRTFLHRLVKKGALSYEEDGNRYLYRAAITRNATIKQAGRSFMSSVFAGQSTPATKCKRRFYDGSLWGILTANANQVRKKRRND